MSHSTNPIDGFFGDLFRTGDLDRAYRQLDDWVDTGHGHYVVDVLDEVDGGAPNRGLSDQLVDLLRFRCERAIAVSREPVLLEALLKRVTCTSETLKPMNEVHARRLRRVATYLGGGLGKHFLFTLFQDHGDDDRLFEFFALLLNELVIRGYPCERDKNLLRFHRRLQRSNHPLRELPIVRVQTESLVQAPTYHRGSLYHVRRLLEGPPGGSPIDSQPTAVPDFRDLTTDLLAEHMAEAVHNWGGGNQGVIEARLFEFSRDLLSFEVTPFLLLSLGLLCLSEVDESQVVFNRLEAADAFQILFQAAANGPTRHLGSYGAWGRLEAWETVAVMAGSDCPDLPLRTSMFAEQSSWVGFRAENDWFVSPEVDFGLACLQPGRRRLAILAASWHEA